MSNNGGIHKRHSESELTRPPTSDTRNGLSLIELMVAIGVIGLLMALLLPAIQSSREAARVIQCKNNLKQISLACANYTETHGCYPAGNLSAFVSVLPELGEATLFSKFTDAANSFDFRPDFAVLRPVVLACPSDGWGTSDKTTTNYNWNRGWDLAALQPVMPNLPTGVVVPAGIQIIRSSDITDGLSQTTLLAEALPIFKGMSGRKVWRDSSESLVRPLAVLEGWCRESITEEPYPWRSSPWISGIYGHTTYSHIVVPNGKTCTFAPTSQSVHSASGVNIAMCDGSIRFISNSIDQNVWQAIGTRSRSDRATD